jgi:hypothetical protein
MADAGIIDPDIDPLKRAQGMIPQGLYLGGISYVARQPGNTARTELRFKISAYAFDRGPAARADNDPAAAL